MGHCARQFFKLPSFSFRVNSGPNRPAHCYFARIHAGTNSLFHSKRPLGDQLFTHTYSETKCCAQIKQSLLHSLWKFEGRNKFVRRHKFGA